MRIFAVIPAAGLSRRMGRPKLTLDLAGQPVISRLLDALNHPDVAATCVVFRQSDDALSTVLQDVDVVTVQPESDPPDMRFSVEYGLAEIGQRFEPHAADGWILIPADHPVLVRGIVEELVAAWKSSDADIMVPTWNGRRGHPAFFRWSLVDRLQEIPSDRGLNWFLTAPDVTVHEQPVESDVILLDLDTPEDYERLCSRFGGD